MSCTYYNYYCIVGSKTLFPAGRVCPVETATKIPSQVPPSDAAIPSITDTLSPTTEGMLKDLVENENFFELKKGI